MTSNAFSRRTTRQALREPSAVPLRVVIAEDSRMIREAIADLLALDDGLEVRASCADLPELIAAIEREVPDVVLTDLRMPPAPEDAALRLAEWLRDTYPQIAMIVVSHYAEPLIALKLIETGPGRRGYLLKTRLVQAQQLAGAIRRVADGGVVVDSLLTEPLLADPSRLDGSALATLDARDRGMLSELAQGKDDAAVADALALSAEEVEQRIVSLVARLGLTGEDDTASRARSALLLLTST